MLRPGDRVTATIWHNPACGTSRNVLAMIRAAGIEPKIIEYLVTPPARQRLIDLVAAAGLTPRGALREKGTSFVELGLGNLSLPDDVLIDVMLANPILINRPFVETSRGTRLCRPSERVLDLLPDLAVDFIKEDGEVIAAPR